MHPNSQARAVRAVELYFDPASSVERLLFTGGNGHGHTLPTNEAELMADFAVRAQVPHDLIEREPNSSSTLGNWANSAAMLRDWGAEEVVGITGRIARHRAAWIGSQVINDYGFDFTIAGYESSKEHERTRATVREIASMGMAVSCLALARRDGVALENLDDFYTRAKSTTGFALVKEHVTHR